MQREKIFNLPGVVLGLIALLALIHGLREYALTDKQDADLLLRFAFVPGRFTYFYDPAGVADTFAAFNGPRGRALENSARYFLGDGKPQWWSVLTHAGLHADWVHCGVNSVWLAAFGTPVARRFGALRFLALFAVCAIGGALMHYALHRFDLNPVVGASAAVSGAMGAACRFIFQPGAPLGDGFNFGSSENAAYRQPALPIASVLTNGQTMPFIALWFVVNFLFGVSAGTLGISDNPIAWEAHIGGFLAGLLLFPLFDPAPRDKAPDHPDDGQRRAVW